MHLYALDEKENVISALDAHKQTNYFCRECHSIVRCRGGFLRQIHFYHLEPNRTCRQSGKSLIHLQIQQYIQTMIPECRIEQRFPSIHRIADVAWEKEKLIFEIQCSSITAREIEERNRDYLSLGYQVIWILHDQLYNKIQLTAAEYFLEETPHYFTNINVEGLGLIYDQWDMRERGKRVSKVAIREIKIFSPRNFSKGSISYPTTLRLFKRLQNWKVCFSGDYLDQILSMEDQEKEAFVSEMAHKEQVFLSDLNSTIRESLYQKCIKVLKFPYRLALHLIIDKLTK